MAKLNNEILGLLSLADKKNGLPAGTMQSIMQQETGGNQKYIDAPDTYHYGLNADGRRIAGHTGKVSTAFGPFGILESTGAQPGYGVAPLKDKSIGEQVRFASEYLAARSKQGGGLQAGLVGYGEGQKYAQQVAGRITQQAPEQLAQVNQVAPEQVAAATAQATATGNPEPVQVVQAAPVQTPWNDFQQAVPQTSMQMAALDYQKMFSGGPEQVQGNAQPNFKAFGKWNGRA